MIAYKYMYNHCVTQETLKCVTHMSISCINFKEKPKSLLLYWNCNIKYIKFILYKHELELANPQFTSTVVVY